MNEGIPRLPRASRHPLYPVSPEETAACLNNAGSNDFENEKLGQMISRSAKTHFNMQSTTAVPAGQHAAGGNLRARKQHSYSLHENEECDPSSYLSNSCRDSQNLESNAVPIFQKQGYFQSAIPPYPQVNNMGQIMHPMECDSENAAVIVKVKQPEAYRHRILVANLLKLFYQQELSRNRMPYDLYRLYTTTIICGIWGLLLMLVSIIFMICTFNLRDIEIAYSSSNDPAGSRRTFQVEHRMNPPIHVYYRIKGFYANYRPYVKDIPQYLKTGGDCEVVSTHEQAFNLRYINGVQTLPWLEKSASTGNYLPQGSDVPVYPCGVQSVSIFNDSVSLVKDISADPVISQWTTVPIDTSNIAYHWDYLQYMVKNNTWLDEQSEPWILTSDHRYRVWMHPPFTPHFQKLYGRINEPLLPNMKYAIDFEETSWPAESWGAEKSFTFVEIGSFGGSNFILFTVTLLAGILCWVGVILLWIFKWTKFFSPSRTIREVDWSLERQMEAERQGLKGSKEDLLLHHKSVIQEKSENRERDSLVNDKRLVDWVAQLPPPLPCLCGLHCGKSNSPPSCIGQPGKKSKHRKRSKAKPVSKESSEAFDTLKLIGDPNTLLLSSGTEPVDAYWNN